MMNININGRILIRFKNETSKTYEQTKENKNSSKLLIKKLVSENESELKKTILIDSILENPKHLIKEISFLLSSIVIFKLSEYKSKDNTHY